MQVGLRTVPGQAENDGNGFVPQSLLGFGCPSLPTSREGRVVAADAAMRRLSSRESDRRLMLDRDLLLESSGGGPCAPVGRVALGERVGPIWGTNVGKHPRVDAEKCASSMSVRALSHRFQLGEP